MRKKVINLLPLILILSVIPLIFRLYQYDTGLGSYSFFTENGIAHDFALHGKMVSFIAVSAVMAVVIIIKTFIGRQGSRIKSAKVFIPLFIYAGLALLSGIFSRYKPYPFTGSFEQFESTFALLGYVLAAYYAFLMIEDEKDIYILVTALSIGAAILTVIGLFQAADHDLFDTALGKWLTIPMRYYRQLNGEGSEFRHKFLIWRVFMTFSNPNYVGSYVPLVLPVTLFMFLHSGKKPVKVMYAALSAGLLICLFGSGSKTGFAGLIVSVVILSVYYCRNGRKKLILSVSGGFLLILVLYVCLGNNDYLKRIRAVFDLNETASDVSGIETSNDGVKIIYRGNCLVISFDPERLRVSCKDDSGADLYMSLNAENELTVDDVRFSGITIAPAQLEEDCIGFYVHASRDWFFANKDGRYLMYTPYGKYIEHEVSESCEWLEKHGNLATGRGYLWSRTLPLLKKHIFLGSGADTFVFEYPNSDFVASYNSDNWGYVVTKPHCMYLQIAVQTGLLSLAAMLAYYIIFVVNSAGCCFKVSDKNRPEFLPGLICAILSGSTGYMTAAFFNDSTIAVAPLFWVLTGIGLAAVRINKK